MLDFQKCLASRALMALLASLTVFFATACGGEEHETTPPSVVGSVASSSSTTSSGSGAGTTTSSATSTSSSTTTSSTTTSTTTTTSGSSTGGAGGEGGQGGAGGAGNGGDPGTGAGGAGGEGGSGGNGGDPSATSSASSSSSSSASSSSSSGSGGGGSPDPVCGNDVVESGEECDDGNLVDGDGCSASCIDVPVSFSCSGWTRDNAFDQLKILDNGVPSDVELVGGIWGPSSTSVYVPIATYNVATIAHWDGNGWSQEALPGSPMSIYDIDGVDDDHVCIAGKLNGAFASFACRANGVWVEDQNKPFAKAYEGVWFAALDDVFSFGWKVSGYFVGRRTNGVWAQPALPSIVPPQGGGYRFTRIWGLDASHVFVAGYIYDASSNAVQALLLFFNGNAWSLVQGLPNTMAEFSAVAGTSIDDVFVTGTDVNGAGVVHHVTSSLTSWSPFVNASVAGYGPALSILPGSALAGGYQLPAVPGSLRITTLDEMAPPATQSVDAMAYNPVRFWREPGTTTIHFVSNVGHYSGLCN